MTALPDIYPHLSLERIHRESALFANRLRDLGCYPFASNDSSAGMEYELQVAVEGGQEVVDLPQAIRQSSFFRNTEKRVGRGDLPPNAAAGLKSFLDHNDSGVWENSWVRFDTQLLSNLAREILAFDLLADKRNPDGPERQDLQRFRVTENGRDQLRIPISYLLKLSFASILDPAHTLPTALQETGLALLHNFQSDNTSPEILSLTIPSAQHGQIGLLAARETARTFFFTQLLSQYANTSFGLAAGGQRCLVYNAPHAPSRQKKLNELVPDGYYRHLFMSPCLSGWDRGEEKHRYMSLCHQTLSRSQLNAITKLKDAGIITNNLVILPNTSNTCLANNGTHVSLGSRLLTTMAGDRSSGLTPGVEKYCGDLVIKIVEHFLPLLVGTYTAAPYRIDFADFHPEKVLGFLPHELDYTHLRMLWRRWKKKADIRFFGKPLTPFGPRRLDMLLASVFRLHGDLIPDFRLIDYFITLLSTDTSPALNGVPGNQEQLKAELAELGIFDNRMSIYLPYRMRAYGQMGYCGFEGRSYSLFPSFLDDMAKAVDLQNLLTALAYRLVLDGSVRHEDIPDQPSVESERRQIFFAAAIGIPTVYIRTTTGNRFLRRILTHVPGQRPSRRYKNYIRITVDEYRLALLAFIRAEGAALIEELKLTSHLDNLRLRLASEKESAWGRLVQSAGEQLGTTRKAERIPAEIFNSGMEQYYRTTLRKSQLQEGFRVLQEDCARLEQQDNALLGQVMARINPAISATDYLARLEKDLTGEEATAETTRNVAHLALAVIHHHRTLYSTTT